MQFPKNETVFVLRMSQLFLNVNLIGNIDNSKIFKYTILVTSDLVSENRVRFERSIKKYFHFCSKSVGK